MSNDPYLVLGVTRDATMSEIKSVYRGLVKKYHPDNYADSPLSDVATEKMQQVNEAYDSIVSEKKTSADGSSSGQGYGSYSSPEYNKNYGQSYGKSTSNSSSNYAYIRSLIHSNSLVKGEDELAKVPENIRDAEWHFLKGSLYFARGWVDDATGQFETAFKKNPNNPEYRAVYNRMMYQRQGNYGSGGYGGGSYRGGSYRGGRGSGGCSGCDMCSSLLCADCCCECMGGDLISCC